MIKKNVLRDYGSKERLAHGHQQHDEYADEVTRISGPQPGQHSQSLQNVKQAKKILGIQHDHLLNRNNDKRSRIVGNSHSALDHHIEGSKLHPVGLIPKHESLARMNNSPSASNLNSINVASLPHTNKKRLNQGGLSDK